MKNLVKTTVLILLILATACKKDEIKPYALEDCAVLFVNTSNIFSMKGHSGEDVVTFRIPVKLFGPVADFDREIGLEVKDSSAVSGKDFNLVSAVIPAGKYDADIILQVNKLQEGVTDLAFRLNIVPNQYFRAGIPKYSTTHVKWTELYSRPAELVWRYWFTFLCPGYSQAFHKLLVDEFGPDVEKYTQQISIAREDPENYIFKSPTWWYAAERQLLDKVSAYDSAHPDAPMMHSDDYELFIKYATPVGEGTHPEIIPTIRETLVVL